MTDVTPTVPSGAPQGPGSRDSVAAPRRLRRVILLLAALGVAATLTLLSSRGGTEDGSGADRDATREGIASEADTDSKAGAKGSSGSGEASVSGDIAEQADDAPSSAGHAKPPAAPGVDRVLVVGQLEDMRLVALAPHVALREAKSTPKRGVTTYGRSDPVGAALSVLPVGRELLVLASDHKQLVRLHVDWRTREVLDLAPALGAVGRGPLNFGPILRVSERAIVIPLAFDASIGLIEVDLVDWSVTRAREFSDRFAGIPGACLTRGGIVVSSTGRVDRFSLTTFERERSVPFEPFAGALACTEDAVWAANIDTPTGRVFDPVTLSDTGRFEWRGSGARTLVSSGEQVLGTDPGAGIVFACDRRRRVCKESASLGRRSTDLLVDGPYLYVTVESPYRLAILDVDSLELHGTLPLPGLPRTLAVLPLTR